MLKIKDDVDLKELLKYGFYYSFGSYFISIDNKEQNKRLFNEPECHDFVFLSCYTDTRKLTLSFQDMEDWWGVDLGILYDLITAGLVEKVEE